jgi:MoaA/NifB/PqqE/SkfB family radical SAM enzyme
MKLSGLHLLLTYRCDQECEHCFVWGSPRQSGTMILATIRQALQQAKDLGSVEWVYFEGGEPFLYYAVLIRGVQEAAHLGFRVGIVTDIYWATEEEDALEVLRPFAGLIQDLSISSDLFHGSEKESRQARNAFAAAKKLGIPIGTICIAQSEAANAAPSAGQLPEGESAVMYRGRAVEKLAAKAVQRPWREFSECPHEDLREPGRVHLDPLGEVHICQGISLGNVFQESLREICASYDAERHPITGPLLKGGPAELVRCYDLPHQEGYADACHLCYEARLVLRGRFPEILRPDQMYGVVE